MEFTKPRLYFRTSLSMSGVAGCTILLMGGCVNGNALISLCNDPRGAPLPDSGMLHGPVFRCRTNICNNLCAIAEIA